MDGGRSRKGRGGRGRFGSRHGGGFTLRFEAIITVEDVGEILHERKQRRSGKGKRHGSGG